MHIIIAAAEVNPLITGFDKKFTIKPIFNKPKRNWIAPIVRANNIAI